VRRFAELLEVTLLRLFYARAFAAHGTCAWSSPGAVRDILFFGAICRSGDIFITPQHRGAGTVP